MDMQPTQVCQNSEAWKYLQNSILLNPNPQEWSNKLVSIKCADLSPPWCFQEDNTLFHDQHSSPIKSTFYHPVPYEDYFLI